MALLACASTLAGEPIDTDLDGLPDTIYVEDQDGDGVMELVDDLQAAVDSLSDPGWKTVQLAPGTFLPPPSSTNVRGIVELPSFTHLIGSGTLASRLQGFPTSDTTSRQAVLSNSALTGSDESILIENVDVDGGWDFAQSGGQTPLGTRMGILLFSCNHCEVRDSYVHDTFHSCLYAKNSFELDWNDNTLTRCGNYGSSTATYPCLYFFADNGGTMRDSRATGNVCTESSIGISTRRADTTATLRDVQFVDNYFEDLTQVCARLRGQGILVDDSICLRTAGIATSPSSQYYADDGVDAADAITVSRTLIRDTIGAPGIALNGFTSAMRFDNVTIDGTFDAFSCVRFFRPFQGLELENVAIHNCSGQGVEESQSSPPGEGSPIFRLVDVDTVGLDPVAQVLGSGFVFRQESGALFDRVMVSNASADGMRWFGPAKDVTLLDTELEDVVVGLRFNSTTDNVSFQGGGVSRTDNDGILLSKTAEAIDHLDFNVDGASFTDIGRHAIFAQAGGNVGVNVNVSNSQFDGVFGSGMILTFDAPGSSTLSVSGNTFNAFGNIAVAAAEVRSITDGVTIAGNSVTGAGANAIAGLYYDGDTVDGLCSNGCDGSVTPCLELPALPTYSVDADSDLTADACDNCPIDPNVDQLDIDMDGLGAPCDLDDDGDGVDDLGDNCSEIANADQLDGDDDLVGDACDPCPMVPDGVATDSDLDGRGDSCDNCPALANASQSDLDADLEGDVCDLDDGVILLLSMDATGLSWQPEAGIATWAVVRGDLQRLLELGEYEQSPGDTPLAALFSGLTATSLSDLLLPPPDSGIFYFVREDIP